MARQYGHRECEARETPARPVEIRDRPPWFRLAQWPCVPDLRAKRDVKLAALCKQWIVAAVVWRQTPNPWQNAQPLETVPLHPKPQLAHRFHGAKKINGCDTDEAIGICSTVLCDLVVADHRAAWTVPRAEHTDGDACTIHLGKRVLNRRRLFPTTCRVSTDATIRTSDFRSSRHLGAASRHR